MARWRVKACPKCHGDMFIDRDLDTWYEQCLQCSYRIEMKPLNVKEPAAADEKGSKKHTHEIARAAR